MNRINHQLRTLFWVSFSFVRLSIAYITEDFSPAWNLPGQSNNGQNYLNDPTLAYHVTGIYIGICTDGAIYTVNIEGGASTNTAKPSAGCLQLATTDSTTFAFGVDERVTQITAVADSLNKWFKLTIKLNTLKTMTLDTSQSSGYPPISPGPQKTYDFPFPANQEFVGFSISGVNNVAPVVGPPPFPAAPCPVTMLQVLVRSATCTVNFDFSQFDTKSQYLSLDNTQTFTFPYSQMYCGNYFKYQVSSISPTPATSSLITLVANSNAVQFLRSTNILDAQTYHVTISYSGGSSSSSSSQLGSVAFSYKYIDRCLSTQVVLQTLSQMTTSVLAASISQDVLASDTVSNFYTATPNLCTTNFAYSISSVPNSGIANLNTTELKIATSGKISVQTDRPTTVGTHQVTVTVVLTYRSTTFTASSTFTLTIENCKITSFSMTPFGTSLDQSYTIGNSLSWSILPTQITTTQVPSCGYSLTLSTQYSISWLTSTASTQIVYVANSNNFTADGTYAVTVTATLVDYSFTPAVASPYCSSTFNIIAVSSCSLSPTTFQATPDPSTMTILTTSVLANPKTQTIIIDDSISKAKNNNFCGNHLYTISSTPVNAVVNALTPSELTIVQSGNSVTISIQTANKDSVGTHSVTLNAQLQSDTSITKTWSFKIVIKECIILSFTITSPTTDQTYIIGDDPKTWQIASNQSPACGYDVQVTSSTPSIVTTFTTGSTFSQQVYTRNLADENNYSVTITCTLSNYPPSYSQGVASNSFTFNLVISNPCSATTISTFPSSIENLAAFAGHIQQSQQKYSFNDTASIQYTTSTDTSDFCGEKLLSFTLNGTSTLLLSALNSDIIYFNPPSDSIDLGVAQATVQASMKNYPAIKSQPIFFQVTILSFIPQNMSNQVYNQSTAPLVIQYQLFEVIPPDFDVGPNYVQAFVFTGTAIPEQLDLKCPCLTRVYDLEWMKVDSIASTLTVQTDNSYFVGEHQIILVQYFQNFPKVNPFTAFNLTINPIPPFERYIHKPPYFEKNLDPQEVVQCPSWDVTPWSFTLPKQLDPNHQPIFLSVSLDSTFFSFDKNTTTIHQISIAEKPVNKTIYITLTSEYGLTETYALFVRFVCNKTESNSFNFTWYPEFQVPTDPKQSPTAKISRIEPSGLVRIQFSQRMKVPYNAPVIQNETVFFNRSVYPIIGFELIPGKYSDSLMTKFTWTYLSFTSQELIIQINFDNMNSISQTSSYPDQIKMTIYGVKFFEDSLGNFMQAPTVLPLKSLPPQASTQEIEQAVHQISTVKKTLFSIIVMLIISGPIQQILSAFRHTQITVHLMLISVNQPATLLIFFGGLMDFVNFQLVDFSNSYNKFFHLDPDSDGNSPFNSQFNMMGYGSLYIVQNFGPLCITLFTPIIQLILTPVVIFIFKVGVCKADLSYLKVKSMNQLFFGFWISFFDETYLFLLVCSSLNLRNYFEWQKSGDAFNSFMSLVFAVQLATFPLFVAYFYRKEKNVKLIEKEDPTFKEKYGSIIEGLNFGSVGRLVLMYPCASLVRKLWLSYMLVFQNDRPLTNIFCAIGQALAMIVVIGLVMPMTEQRENKRHLYNEFFVLLFSYGLLMLTDFVWDLQTRNEIGKMLISVSQIDLGLNLTFVAVQNMIRILRKVKLQYLKWKQNKRLQLRLKHKTLQQTLNEHRVAKEQAEIAEALTKVQLRKEEINSQNDHFEKDIQTQHSNQIVNSQPQPKEIKEHQLIFLNDKHEHLQPVDPVRSALLKSLAKYTQQRKNSCELSEQEQKKCRDIVWDNELGADLRPVGRLQGPFEATNHFDTCRSMISGIVESKVKWLRLQQILALQYQF